MSKKKNKKVTDPQVAAADAKTVETVVETPETAPAPVYGFIQTVEDLEKRPVRKGFETVLITELQKGPGTVQQLTDRMLASGEYARVAPRAAELRPTKPVQFLLTKWVGSGRVAIASAEEAAAVLNAAAIAAQIEGDVPSPELSGEGSASAAPADDNAQAEATVGASV